MDEIFMNSRVECNKEGAQKKPINLQSGNRFKEIKM